MISIISRMLSCSGFTAQPQKFYLYKPSESNCKFINQINHSFPLLLPLKFPHKPNLLISIKQRNPSYSTPSSSTMDSSSSDTEVAYDLSPVLKVYKSGRIERLAGEGIVPPSLDPKTNVESKDVVISKEEGISARFFLPKITDSSNPKKLPLLVFFHGGAFCIETPFSPNYHNYLNSLVSGANVVGVSVHYRRAPEHPVPTGHEDSWTALKWVASHSGGNGPDEWLNRFADFGKVFLAGDSSGANIAHHMGIRIGSEGFPGVKLAGIALVQPFFWGEERIGSEANMPEYAAKIEELLRFSCPGTSGFDDPLINPAKDPNLGSLAGRRLLVCVAEKDLMRDRGWYYKELLQKSGWGGVLEVMETKDENHAFHLFKPNSENALALLNRIVTFLKGD